MSLHINIHELIYGKVVEWDKFRVNLIDAKYKVNFR